MQFKDCPLLLDSRRGIDLDLIVGLRHRLNLQEEKQ